MTPAEYVQLKAFARQDGAFLSLLWIGSFFCYLHGFTHPFMGMAAVLLLIASPFFAANRLRHFRDEAREGVISFLRAYAYTVLIFFYAGLLLCAAVYVYFAFMDKGYLVGMLTDILHSEQGRQMVQTYGLGPEMEEGLKAMSDMRPIDYALNMLSVNISAGLLLGLPIAALMQRQTLNIEH